MADDSPIPEIISRQEAKARGLKRYFTGKPCPHGHIAERWVSSGGCYECVRLKAPGVVKRWRDKQDPDGLRAWDAARMRLHYTRYPDQRRAYARDQYHKNPGKAAVWHKRWLTNNADYVREYDRNYLATNLVKRLRVGLRTRLNIAIKRGYRAGSAVRDLGCSISEFKVWIEAQFEPGMSWDNWGEWELDHIKPLALFDLTYREQFLTACHYTNYQPLWRADNLAKRAIDGSISSYIPSK